MYGIFLLNNQLSTILEIPGEKRNNYDVMHKYFLPPMTSQDVVGGQLLVRYSCGLIWQLVTRLMYALLLLFWLDWRKRSRFFFSVKTYWKLFFFLRRNISSPKYTQTKRILLLIHRYLIDNYVPRKERFWSNLDRYEFLANNFLKLDYRIVFHCYSTRADFLNIYRVAWFIF